MNETLTIPDRDRDHESVLGIVFGLSPAQAGVLSCLVRCKIATGDQLLVYTETKSYMKVVVSRTRKKLQFFGCDIKSKMGVGYWMEPDDKTIVEKAVAKFLGGK